MIFFILIKFGIDFLFFDFIKFELKVSFDRFIQQRVGQFLNQKFRQNNSRYKYLYQVMTQETTQPQKRPEFVNGIRVRMPEEYDFNTWGKDYTEYNKEFRLRTDAVWEKYQLKDWFRLTSKVFFFNKRSMKYQFVEPDDVFTLLFEPWGFEEEEIMDWHGFTHTGVTTAFQAGIGPKQKVESTFNSFYSMPDYYIMCAMRFEKWFRCDHTYGDDRATEYDRSPENGLTNMKDEDHYPCFREWYEASYACADNIMRFLMELSYAKKAQDFWQGDVSNTEIRMFPTIYDSPSAPDRITYTY